LSSLSWEDWVDSCSATITQILIYGFFDIALNIP
jgi:hypothetical protein